MEGYGVRVKEFLLGKKRREKQLIQEYFIGHTVLLIYEKQTKIAHNQQKVSVGWQEVRRGWTQQGFLGLGYRNRYKISDLGERVAAKHTIASLKKSELVSELSRN